MMSIDITYIIVAFTFLLVGFVLGKIWGRHRGHMDVLHIGLEVKNPEMWELLHYLVVEKREKQRAAETAAIEKKVTRRMDNEKPPTVEIRSVPDDPPDESYPKKRVFPRP